MPAKKEPGTEFGKRLFALRKARGLTQVQLAEALGATQRVISYYETEAELPQPPRSSRWRRCLKSRPMSCWDWSSPGPQDANTRSSSGYGRGFRRWKPCRRRISEP